VNASRSIARLAFDGPALSTSGTGERGFTVGGRWCSHVIDPSTGMPMRKTASATVIGEYAELMEVASKILLLRGCKKGLAICESLGWVADGLTVTETHGGLLAVEHPDGLFIEMEPYHDTHPACIH
jgi:thiamine biosynthesis lipoprotein ApbE